MFELFIFIFSEIGEAQWKPFAVLETSMGFHADISGVISADSGSGQSIRFRRPGEF